MDLILKMKLLTGHKGFIGQNLAKRFDKESLFVSEMDRCFDDLTIIPWDEIDEIWHMGAISDTTCNDLDSIHRYNVEYSIKLFEIAIQFQIPVKYASSASVYGNTNYRREINPLNFYSMSKVTIDRWVLDNLYKFVRIQIGRAHV